MARRKHVKRIDPRYFLHETVNRGEELEEKRIGSMLDPKTYKHPDPEDPNWPWKPGESVEGDRAHPYEAQPVMGTPKREPGETRAQYEKRLMKGKHRAAMRHPDPGELDPYELEESWADDDAGGWQRQYQRDQGYRVKGPVVPSSTTEDERKKRAADRRRRDREREEGLEEGCPHAEEPNEIDISSPGIEVHVEDISNLPPDEAFAAGLAAAKDAIDQMLSAPQEAPPEGEGPLQERSRLNEADGETPEDVAQRISNIPPMFRDALLGDMRLMAKGHEEHHAYYPHVENHAEFARAVLQLLGEG